MPAPVPPPGLLVRRAAEADLADAVELLRLGVVPGASPADEGPDALPLYRAAWREIDAGSGALLVAELEGTVVGVCQLIVFRHFQRRGGLCAEVESMHVLPAHRGAGVGTVLLGDAVERARALGCYRVQLTSNAARGDAHRFYERLGFAPTHVGFKLLLDGSVAPLA